MCAVFTSLGSATAYILLASLLVAGAGGVSNWVITQQCNNRGSPWPVRQYPEDRDATWLRLDSCSLDEINGDDIIGLPNITMISFGNNAIARVDLVIFRHVPTLIYLHLYDNKLRELPAFPERSCPRLTELLLHNNQLTTLHDGIFSACTQLAELRFDYNHISDIHPNVFSSLTELVSLYLSNNKLSYIPDQMLGNNRKLRTLYLFNNRLTHLHPDFASSFKRAGVGLDEFYFHSNPWRCACLLELLADVMRAGARYYDSWHKKYYDGTRPVCTYSGTAPCCRHPPSRLLPPPRVAAGGGR